MKIRPKLLTQHIYKDRLFIVSYNAVLQDVPLPLKGCISAHGSSTLTRNRRAASSVTTHRQASYIADVLYHRNNGDSANNHTPLDKCTRIIVGFRRLSDYNESVRVTLRLAVYRQSVRLGKKPLETHDQ
jgi:hypothetical protein